MFPHPQDLLASACKVQRDNDLMVIATTVTKTPYPKALALTTKQDLADACQNLGLVIKRDFSDSTSCTYLPPQAGEGGDRTTKVMNNYTETNRFYKNIECLPHPSWIAQPYIPSLVEKGELRAFIVGGRLAFVIHSWPMGGLQQSQVVDNFTPLDIIE
jgi:hypothetical protein